MWKKSVNIFAFATILFFINPCFSYKPVVLLHGIMTGSQSMEMISHRIQEKHPGTVIYNVNRFESWSSLETMWHQVLEIGRDIANFSSNYPDGINLIGYSQGGLLARGIVQMFPNVSVSTFISLSAPQAGQYGAGFLHIVFPGLLKDSAYQLFYSRVGQHTSVGNYWNDPYHQKLYQSYSVYLPYINNHIASVKSEDFKNNLLKLKRLVLIGGPDDQVITPWQSRNTSFVDLDITGMAVKGLKQVENVTGAMIYGTCQFGYYDTDNLTVVEMRSQPIYLEDRIGLRALDAGGRLRVRTVRGVNHFGWHTNVTIVDDHLLPFLD